jgi:formylglycine-generating enzyme
VVLGARPLLLLASVLFVACEQASAASGANQSAAESAVEPSETEAVESDGPAAEAPLTALGRPSVPEEAEPSSCPADMVLVEGDYCPNPQQACKRYLDPPGRYEHFRCAEYGPSTCQGKRVHKRYCIDRDEYTAPGETLPANNQSWTKGEATCSSLGKRMCLESEWVFACEGEEMRPYPYGFERDPTACNADHTDIVSAAGTLKDLRVPSDEYPRCTSPFGVRNMAGNLEEFVTIDGSTPARPAMKGAYWQPSRNQCRAAQTAHDRYYNGTETGFRCCAEAAP